MVKRLGCCTRKLIIMKFENMMDAIRISSIPSEHYIKYCCAASWKWGLCFLYNRQWCNLLSQTHLTFGINGRDFSNFSGQSKGVGETPYKCIKYYVILSVNLLLNPLMLVLSIIQSIFDLGIKYLRQFNGFENMRK